jgi:lactoylglutathione lyase
MNIVRSGLILNTENYDACVDFYMRLFGLPILYQHQQGEFRLTCLDNHGAYLMIETGGVASPQVKTMRQGSTKLRFNVSCIEAALVTLRAFGIDADIVENDWGATINIHDPDGNRVGIRDQARLAKQISDWQPPAADAEGDSTCPST